MKMQAKGFTLIEILIVVVILAVLASLILPRFLQQPERAIIAEAQMMLGALRRAQLTYADMTGAGNNYLGAVDSRSFPPDNGWTTLGLADNDTDASFNYACAAGPDATLPGQNPAIVGGGVLPGTCVASKLVDGVLSWIVISMEQGTYACDGAYSPVVAAGPNTQGCML